MRKARQSMSVPLSVKLPPKKIREKFLLTYELEGCQKAVRFPDEILWCEKDENSAQR